MPTPPRTSTSNKANQQVASVTNKMNFVGDPLPILDFVDEIEAEGGKITDFRYNVIAKTEKGPKKTCLLSFRKAVAWDDEGNASEFKSFRAFASDEAYDALMKNRGTDSAYDGITVSAFKETDQKTGKETGEIGYVLCKVTGESAMDELNALRAR